MDMTQCINMNPNILLGIANDRLRHECEDLKSLARLMEVEQQQIENKFAEIGFHYEKGLNQFRPDLN